MMERAEETYKKRRQMAIANEEAVHEHKREQRRQGFRYCPNPEQSGYQRYINVKYQGGPDLPVPIENSSTTSGVFAANPFIPIFNPYMQRPLYQNKRYLKQKKNKNKHQNKFTYKQPHEPEQIQAPKTIKRSGETEKQKGKIPASENENPTQYNTPTKKSKTRSQAHSAEDHKKSNQKNKRTRVTTDNQKPIQDKLFTVVTNKVITMLRYKRTRALDELVGSNKGKIRLISRAYEKTYKKGKRNGPTFRAERVNTIHQMAIEEARTTEVSTTRTASSKRRIWERAHQI
jgi:hypothetical protein